MAYRIAGYVFDVKARYETVPRILEPYRDGGIPEVTIEITQDDIEHERDLSKKIDPDSEHTDRYLESLALLRKLSICLLSKNTILMHGSAVAVDGEAYIFTAESGTGKSTHARLWRENLDKRVIMVNDDKPFLRVEEDRIVVCGSPWNGKHGLGENIEVPLRAICVLEQATENHIERIDFTDAIPVLMQQIYIPTQEAYTAEKALELADRIYSGVDLFRLGANMEPEAAKLSYGTMSGR